MLEINYVAVYEHEISIRDDSKFSALFEFFGGTEKNIVNEKNLKNLLQSENVTIETLMEEIELTFIEKHVFDSKWKSVYVATYGLLTLPAVSCHDQKEGFQKVTSSKSVQVLNQEQKGGKKTKVIDWIDYGYGEASNTKTLLGSLKLSAFQCEDQNWSF